MAYDYKLSIFFLQSRPQNNECLNSRSLAVAILFQSELVWCARIVVRPLFSVFVVESSNMLARTKSNKKEASYLILVRYLMSC